MFSYVDINFDNIEGIVEKLAHLVKKTYDFDMIISVANGGTLIGSVLSKITGDKLLEINVSRNGVKNKPEISSLVSRIPKKPLILIKQLERKRAYNVSNYNRTVRFDKQSWNDANPSKILIIDDAIDTGYTIIEVIETVRNKFPNSDIKVAVINYFSDRNVKRPDFSLYVDSVISAPWTIDSKEYAKFLKMNNDI